MRVTSLVRGFVCWIRNESDGTVLREPGVEGVMKCSSGRVKCPARKACSRTVARLVVSEVFENGDEDDIVLRNVLSVRW